MIENLLKPLAWLLIIIAPCLIYPYLLHLGLDPQVSLFTAIAVTTTLFWMFNLLPELIPALLALLAVMVFGLAPESVILSGFSSIAFLLAFSIMGLGVVIIESGLSYRYTLFLLHRLPANTRMHQAAIFFTGFLFTPIVPTIIGRASIVGPVMTHLVAGWDPPTRARSSTMLYTTGLDSIHYLAPWFLTAAPANLMVFALLPPQDQQTFDFMFWAYAASVTGLSLLGFYFLTSWLFFRGHGKVALDRAAIARQRLELGPMSRFERVTLFGVILLALGIVTMPLHRLEVHFIAFAVLCFLMYLGVLDRRTFIAKIDWAFLVLLAAIIGLMATMQHLHIDRLLVERLGLVSELMREDFTLFVLLFSLVVLGVRLLIPLNSAILILATAAMPFANQAGIAPWLVGFIMLIIAETAFFAYQSPYIYFLRNLTQTISYSEARVQTFHALLIPCKLAAIYLSVPFWHHLGLL